jgi:hypothetical protein
MFFYIEGKLEFLHLEKDPQNPATVAGGFMINLISYVRTCLYLSQVFSKRSRFSKTSFASSKSSANLYCLTICPLCLLLAYLLVLFTILGSIISTGLLIFTGANTF